jgi:hypothetical protein
MCTRCKGWFDRRKGAAARGKKWLLICEDCRSAAALARKRRADMIPEGVILRALQSQIEDGEQQKSGKQARLEVFKTELARFQQRKLVRPVEGQQLTRRELKRAWDNLRFEL